jgi:histone deacetylase complex regulatory component SIN3
MPINIQRQISHDIDASIGCKIMTASSLVHDKIGTLSRAQENSFDLINGNLKNISDKVSAKAIEDHAATSRLEDRLELVQKSQGLYMESTTALQTSLTDLSVAHQHSTDLVIREIRQVGNSATKETQRQRLEGRAQSSGLHTKLDHIESSIGMLRKSIQSLSDIQLVEDPDLSKTEMERTAHNILRGIWLLLSSLQLLIRELL